jgi:hypothetical protein
MPVGTFALCCLIIARHVFAVYVENSVPRFPPERPAYENHESLGQPRVLDEFRIAPSRRRDLHRNQLHATSPHESRATLREIWADDTFLLSGD